jgi:hypothetical protein
MGCVFRKATELFDGVENQLEYMEDFGFDAARIHVLEFDDRFSDAAAVALQERNTFECVRLLLLSTEDGHIHQAVGHALHGLWTLSPYASASFSINRSDIGILLKQVLTIKSTTMDDAQRRQVSNLRATYGLSVGLLGLQVELFQALHDGNLDRTKALAKSNAALARTAEALLCFTHCSSNLTTLQNSSISELVAKLSLFLSCCSMAVKVTRSFDAFNLETQRLLGFGPIQNSPSSDAEQAESSGPAEFWIYSSSFLFESAKDVSGSPEPTPFALGLSAVIASESDVQRLATSALLGQLKSDVKRMHNAATAVWYLRPCLDFGIFGNCMRSDCGRQEVSSIQLGDLDRQKHFNLRLRAHVLQVLTIHNYAAQNALDERESRDMKRYAPIIYHIASFMLNCRW